MRASESDVSSEEYTSSNSDTSDWEGDVSSENGEPCPLVFKHKHANSSSVYEFSGMPGKQFMPTGFIGKGAEWRVKALRDLSAPAGQSPEWVIKRHTLVGDYTDELVEAKANFDIMVFLLLYPEFTPLYHNAGEGCHYGYRELTKNDVEEVKFYWIQPRVPGENLKILISDPSFTFEERINASIEILRVAKRMHTLGVLHRDIKPENIIYDRINGKAYIVDFGLGCSIENPDVDQPGTFLYMPVDAVYVDDCNPYYYSLRRYPNKQGIYSLRFDPDTDEYLLEKDPEGGTLLLNVDPDKCMVGMTLAALFCGMPVTRKRLLQEYNFNVGAICGNGDAFYNFFHVPYERNAIMHDSTGRIGYNRAYQDDLLKIFDGLTHISPDQRPKFEEVEKSFEAIKNKLLKPQKFELRLAFNFVPQVPSTTPVETAAILSHGIFCEGSPSKELSPRYDETKDMACLYRSVPAFFCRRTEAKKQIARAATPGSRST